MPFCPNCKTEYRKGFTECYDCQIDLVDELIDDKRLAELKKQGYDIFEDWISIRTFEQNYEAQQLVDLFDYNGIHSQILSQADSMFKLPGELSIIRVMIQLENFDKAIEILKNQEEN